MRDSRSAAGAPAAARTREDTVRIGNGGVFFFERQKLAQHTLRCPAVAAEAAPAIQGQALMHPPTHENRHGEIGMLLKLKKQELLRSVRRSMAEKLDEDTRFVFEANQDLPDQSVDDLRRHIDAALTGRRSEDIDAIDAALRRIEEGCYGICAECGDEIPEQRLAAMPFANSCVECQRLLEQRAAACGDGPADAPSLDDDYLSDKE